MSPQLELSPEHRTALSEAGAKVLVTMRAAQLRGEWLTVTEIADRAQVLANTASTRISENATRQHAGYEKRIRTGSRWTVEYLLT